MKDQKKTKEQLISELEEMRLKNAEFEAMEAKQEQAGAELLKKHWNLLAILRASPLAIISADIEGKIVMWNPAAERIFGWSEQEVLGRPNPIVPKNKEEEFRNLHERALRRELLADTEVCRQKKDGSLIDVSISRAPLHDTNGDIVGVIAIVLDITERKRTQQKVEEQLQFLQTLLDTIPSPVFYKNAEGRYTGCNKAFEDFVGIPAEEIIGKTVYDMGPKEIADEYYEKDRELFEKPGKQHYEWKVKTNDGELKDVIFSKATIRNTNGDVEGLIGVISDITERRAFEEALRESVVNFKALAENANDGILIATGEGVHVYANRRTAEITGYSIAELLEMGLRDLVAPDEIEKVTERLNRRLAGEDPPRQYETIFIRKSGEKFPVELSAARSEWEGRPASIVIIHDIAERKRAEEVLRQRETELEIRANELEELNSALRVLLRKRDEDQSELEEKVLSTVKALVLPYVERLKRSGLDPKQKAYLNIVESNLDDIVSPFARKLSSIYVGLTPTEINVATLIKEGNDTKEIAELLNMSYRTVETHRRNIRKKLGLKRKRTNLRSHLLSIQ